MPASKEILTLLKRDLMQAVWSLLLNDDFLQAYKDGIVVLCGDGKKRRIFPRIFTYSADYPEQYIPSPKYVAFTDTSQDSGCRNQISSRIYLPNLFHTQKIRSPLGNDIQ